MVGRLPKSDLSRVDRLAKPKLTRVGRLSKPDLSRVDWLAKPILTRFRPLIYVQIGAEEVRHLNSPTVWEFQVRLQTSGTPTFISGRLPELPVDLGCLLSKVPLFAGFPPFGGYWGTLALIFKDQRLRFPCFFYSYGPKTLISEAAD